MSSGYVQIVGDDAPFPWQYTDDDGQTLKTVFTLRKVPSDIREQFEKAHTSFGRWRRGGQRERLVDNLGFAHDCIDYAIVNWDAVEVMTTDADGHVVRKRVPCERDWKLALPELLKAEIARVCVGGDVMGLMTDETETAAGDGSQETAPPPDPLASSAAISIGDRTTATG